MKHILAIACLILAANTAQAETVYVVDMLRVGVRPLPSGRGKALEVVSTGTPLTVLERTKRMVKVRTPKGTLGWLASAYTIPEPPARDRIANTDAQQAALEQTLQRAKDQLEQEARQRQGLGDRLRESVQKRERLERTVAAQAERLAQLQRSERVEWQHLGMVAVGGVILALITFFLGAASYRRRASRRLGGLRI